VTKTWELLLGMTLTDYRVMRQSFAKCPHFASMWSCSPESRDAFTGMKEDEMATCNDVLRTRLVVALAWVRLFLRGHAAR
jgi:hypothetical protein